jgi:hypothetical protein
MRRRLREQRRLREALLLDLGALVYELHRQGKRAPELLQQKAAELTVVDEEVRELQAALDGREAPARETTDAQAVGDEEGEEGADGEEPVEDLDDELDEETGEERALDEDEPRADHEEIDEDEARADDETGEVDELAPEDESLEHEGPRA